MANAPFCERSFVVIIINISIVTALVLVEGNQFRD